MICLVSQFSSCDLVIGFSGVLYPFSVCLDSTGRALRVHSHNYSVSDLEGKFS